MSTGLVLDLRGRLRNLQLPASRALVPVFEAIVNSLHAVEATGRASGRVTVEVLRVSRQQQELALGDPSVQTPITGFRIRDDGVGLTDDNYGSFCTSDSTFKFAVGGRGVGRFTWLKAFRKVRIESVYSSPDGKKRLLRAFDFSDRGVPKDKPKDAKGSPVGTVITLQEIREEYAQHLPKRLETLAQRIVDHCFAAIRAAKPSILVEAVDGDHSVDVSAEVERMFATALKDEVEVAGSKFALTHIQVTSPEVAAHRLAFLANRREVRSDNLGSSIPQLKSKLADPDGRGFWWLTLVESHTLDEAVNSERDSFSFPEEPLELFPDRLSMALLRREVVPVVLQRLGGYLEPIKERAEQRVRQYVSERAPEYRHLLTMRLPEIRSIPPDLPDDRLDAELHRVTYQVEAEIRQKGREILTSAAPPENAYDEFVSEANAVGKANLAKYVVHRRVMLDLFRKALERNPGGKYELEEAVHRLVFPLRATSDEVRYADLNLWMLDERLAYHEYLASDKELRSIDVLDSDGRQRPDLIVFNTPFAFVDHPVPFGSIVIVEFKRPARDDYDDDENPIKQVYDYVRKIRSGTAKDRAGRPLNVSDRVPFYCYVACDMTPRLKETAENYELKETPDGMGFFGFNTKLRAYIEVITFDKLVSDAEKRNRILFAKLNLPT